MINALITTTVFATVVFGFIARAHDGIMARRKPQTVTIQQPQQAEEPMVYKISFIPTFQPQTANVLGNTPIRQLKAMAKEMGLTPVTTELFGKRYSLCKAGELREAIAYALAQ